MTAASSPDAHVLGKHPAQSHHAWYLQLCPYGTMHAVPALCTPCMACMHGVCSAGTPELRVYCFSYWTLCAVGYSSH